MQPPESAAFRRWGPEVGAAAVLTPGTVGHMLLQKASMPFLVRVEMKFLWSMAAAFVGALVILVFGVVYGLHLATYGRPDPGRIFAGLAFVAAGLTPIVAATFLSIRSSIGKPLGKTAKVLLWATALPWGALGVYVLWINGRRLNPELLPVLAFAVGFTASLVLYPGDRERDAGSGDHRDSTEEGR